MKYHNPIKFLVIDLHRNTLATYSWDHYKYKVWSEELKSTKSGNKALFIEDPRLNSALKSIEGTIHACSKCLRNVYIIDWTVRAIYRWDGLELRMSRMLELGIVIFERNSMELIVDVIKRYRIGLNAAVLMTCGGSINFALKLGKYFAQAFNPRPQLIAITLGRVFVEDLDPIVQRFCRW